MRYVVIGAGAVGGTIAARLAAAGEKVVVVARGEHAEAMKKRGLTLLTPDGPIKAAPKVWRHVQHHKLTEEDVLIFAVKTQDAHAAIAQWAAAELKDGRSAGEALPALVCLNGVLGEEIALRHFRRVYGVCVWSPCSYSEPGVVAAYFTPASGVYHMGRYPAALNSAADKEFLDQVKTAWDNAGLLVKPHADVMKWKWRKLINNLGNVFDALLAGQDGADQLVSLARKEAIHTINVAGISMTPDPVEATARREGPSMGEIKEVPYAGSSSRQSLARGSGTIETQYLNGEIARLAHRSGRTAPINARISVVAERAARDGVAPGEYPIEQLRTELGLL